jgi:hypothetical protein
MNNHQQREPKPLGLSGREAEEATALRRIAISAQWVDATKTPAAQSDLQHTVDATRELGIGGDASLAHTASSSQAAGG